MLKRGTAATKDRQVASFTTGRPAVTMTIPAGTLAPADLARAKHARGQAALDREDPAVQVR